MAIENKEEKILPELLEDLGYLLPTANSKKKAKYGIYKCPYCNSQFKAMWTNIKNAKTKSCGCQNHKPTHGLNGSKFYATWTGMMRRCYTTTDSSYTNYGARGITVCEDWKDITNYVKWAESTYVEGMTMDRKDNNKGYSPENCRWADNITQGINQRVSKHNTSGYLGVSFNKQQNKWRASLRINTVRKHIGSFDTAIEAAKARDMFITENNLPNNLSIETATLSQPIPCQMDFKHESQLEK